MSDCATLDTEGSVAIIVVEIAVFSSIIASSSCTKKPMGVYNYEHVSMSHGTIVSGVNARFITVFTRSSLKRVCERRRRRDPQILT